MAGERDGVGHGDFLVLFPPASARAVRFVVCLRWGGGDSSRGGTVPMRVSELAGRVGNSGCGGGRDVARRGGFAPPARRGYGAAVRGGGCEASRSAELAEEKRFRTCRAWRASELVTDWDWDKFASTVRSTLIFQKKTHRFFFLNWKRGSMKKKASFC